MEVCPCGDTLRSHQVKAGKRVTCNGCGRTELFPNEGEENLFNVTPDKKNVQTYSGDAPPWKQ